MLFEAHRIATVFKAEQAFGQQLAVRRSDILTFYFRSHRHFQSWAALAFDQISLLCELHSEYVA